MIMFPIVESANYEPKNFKEPSASMSISKSLFKKKMLSQDKKIYFASNPEKTLSEETDTQKSTCSTTNDDNITESEIYLKFPRIKGSETTGEDDKHKSMPVNFREILGIIEPFSKQLEKDKIKVDPFRFFDLRGPTTTQSLLSILKAYEIPSFFPDKPVRRKFYDWRGTVAEIYRTYPVFRGSWYRKNWRALYQEYLSQIPKLEERKKGPKGEAKRSKDMHYTADFERIGPHLDIYRAFQGHLHKRKDKLAKKFLRAATLIQGAVRGWLERKRLARVKLKAKDHGPSFKAVVRTYQRMIDRIQRRAGLRNTRVILKFSELEEWLDRKKFYEIMFTKKDYSERILKSELPRFFGDCGHFPTQSHIDNTFLLVRRYNEFHSEAVTRARAIEMLFTLYPPEGAHVSHFWGIKSTWTRPIVRGEEAYKYIVSGHPILKRADIQVVGKLVANSMRERKMKLRFKKQEE
ncbi:IQ domain-containing protein M isoform X1 [Monodelphis domestica]|uniref:IQ domain-containing protein M isoform X1 n=2 Tax=Monodelphis domestica TaxID=13616 RepID=UPI0024E207A6|nr:IQ domain-containing protein M isoform X1 [Monodelphis domestica]